MMKMYIALMLKLSYMKKNSPPSSPDGFYCLVDIWIDGLIYLQ